MDDLPVLEPSAVSRLEEWGGIALPYRMISIFLEHSPSKMEQIRDGIHAGEPERAGRGAHSLKSSAGNLGALRLQALAERVERMGESGDLEGLRAILPSMEEALAAVSDELRTLMEGLEK